MVGSLREGVTKVVIFVDLVAIFFKVHTGTQSRVFIEKLTNEVK